MSIATNIGFAKTGFKIVSHAIEKRAPEIFIGAGIIGMGVALYSAIKDEPKTKAEIILSDMADERGTDELPIQDKVVAYGKAYWKPVVIFAASAASILWGHKITLTRCATLAAAYALSEESFSDYKDAVKRTIGEKKEEACRINKNQNYVTDDPVEDAIINTGTGFTLCYDVPSRTFFYGNLESVKAAANKVNHYLATGSDEVTWGDYLHEARIMPLRGKNIRDINHLEDKLGWNNHYNGDLLELEIDSTILPSGRTCCVIDYKLYPMLDLDAF